MCCKDSVHRSDLLAVSRRAAEATLHDLLEETASQEILDAEQLGNPAKLFMGDRVNPVRVLSGDGLTATVIANPPADWSGDNQPYCLCSHGGDLLGRDGRPGLPVLPDRP